ncbi:MAG: MBL fold metallo-hydrolase [Acidimicrobiales bacterium]
MSNELVYLKPNVVIQPLVDRWYAWSHLIPPVTLGLNHLGRHLRIMDSFVEAPDLHRAAARDPALAGGPFIDVGSDRVEEIAALADQIRRRRAGLLELSRAVQHMADVLADKATGYSIDALYNDVEPVLRGFVELSYDLWNRPSFRLIEPLLYASPHYDRTAQSLALFETAGDARPFVLSTPSLDEPGRLHIDLDFSSTDVDALAELKWSPQPRHRIGESFGLSGPFERFLTPCGPPRRRPYDGPGVRWRYFGHACVLVESAGVSILTDPVIAYRHSGPVPRFTFHDLPAEIDCVLITHAHQDHTMLETLLQIRHRVGVIVVPRSGAGSLQDPSLKLLLLQLGFPRVVEVDELDKIDLGPVNVRALPFQGEHADLDIRAKMTYLVEALDHRLFFGADTCNVEPVVYEHVRHAVGGADTIFLGMECDGAPLDWLYGPLMLAPTTRESRRMGQSRRLSGSDCDKAVGLVRTLGAKRAYVYSMGQEPWLKHLLSLQYQPDSLPIVESDKLVAWCQDAGIESERLFGRKEACLA